jgi:hypothetical protein
MRSTFTFMSPIAVWAQNLPIGRKIFYSFATMLGALALGTVIAGSGLLRAMNNVSNLANLAHQQETLNRSLVGTLEVGDSVKAFVIKGDPKIARSVMAKLSGMTVQLQEVRAEASSQDAKTQLGSVIDWWSLIAEVLNRLLIPSG